MLARLDQRGRAALREFQRADGDPKVAARALGEPVSMVIKVIERTMAMIADYADTIEEARAAYARLAESLFSQGEDR